VTIVPPKDGAVLPVRSGAHDVYTRIPAGPTGRVLRLAEHADPDWQATLDGTPLHPVTLDGDWAQAFELPASGGRLDVTRTGSLAHTGWIAGQLLLGLVVLVLALPGRRSHKDDDLPEEVVAAQALAAAAEAPLPGSRRARRMAERGEGEGDGPDPSGVYAGGPDQGGAAAGHPDGDEPFADPYQADPYQGAGYQDAYGWEQSAQGTPEHEGAADGQGYEQGYDQGYDPQAYPVGYQQQGYDQQGYDQSGYQQPGHDQGYQPQPGYEGGQYADPYAPYGYEQQQYQGNPAEQEQPWVPGQQQGEPYYDPNAAHQDGYGNGGHPHHHGSGS
jgi:hypothetical protein